ncbi:carbohydrate-binding module family 21 protein [Aplosporella prunicola CBS 121167]|uniref:Carbohydrate-binding module family 21 protein n=1 Tax=Aplosporella prunicola CBS 121167 TaxID=1176127 RepID=A0A6A6BN50_9PEZI|nr:carbohydrate-binding module family 21 protein [Aplosporella prunicola CBS 121167]KAF2144257.1 carbohydrate-binding module family 21 protein [Aplosporella prunicola CBS 121167]
MPYTPPSQRSPASSKTNSPILSRSHSYSEATGVSSPTSAAHRSVLPHSVSSTAYLSKHRRTPSISDSPTQGQNGANGQVTAANGRPHHPNPPTKLLIPVGADATPPDSVQNSDDEDRGRRHEGKFAELAQALQSIEVKRGHSPERHANGTASAPPEPEPQHKPLRPALTPEARKISHSRSTSDVALSSHVKDLTVSPMQTSESSEDDDDDGLSFKPALVRKKSGELVKPALRPTSRNRRRPSSMPGTPSFSKAVHFNDDIEQVRHFLQVDRPIAVSAGSSPVETHDSEHEYPFSQDDHYSSRRVEWELRLSNFPRETFERKALPVHVEKLSLSPDQRSLVGSVAVANLAFHKSVVARFTLDYWKTTSEVAAEFNDDVRKKQMADGKDHFTFNIKLADQAHLETKTLLLCVRYNVNGQEFWDNNNAMNFQVDFIKKMQPKVSRSGRPHGARAGSLGSIPRSRHSPPANKSRTLGPSFDDDFDHSFGTQYEFGGRGSSFNDSTGPALRLKSKSKPKTNLFPDQPNRNSSPTAQAFSTRYDFGASLTAALSTAQNALGDRSGIKKQTPKSKSDYFSLQGEAPSAPKLNAPRPDEISSVKPDLKSAEYNELIQKYCFFGSGRGSPQVSSPKPTATDGTREIDSDGSAVSPTDTGSGSPSPSKEGPPAVDGANDPKTQPRSQSPFLSRSTSPAPVTGSDFGDRTTSPVSFGYPFNNNMHGGIFPENHALKAIIG